MLRTSRHRWVTCLLFTVAFCTGSPLFAAAEDGAFIMVYPEREKLPMIGTAPDNRGIYQDLFTEAARRAGFKLEIQRVPKQRAYHDLEQGTADFYPGSGFSEDRAKFIFWIENGLVDHIVCLTAAAVPTFGNLADAPPLRIIVEAGSTKGNLAAKFPQLTGVPLGEGLTIERGVELITADRADIFIANMEQVDSYQQRHGKNALEKEGFRVHPDCTGGPTRTYLGFSRNSPRFKGIANPDFKPAEPVSIENFPVILQPDSPVDRLARALLEMIKDGSTAAIYQRAFGS